MSQDLVPFWANAGPSELSWGIFQSTAGINTQETKSHPQSTTRQYQGLQRRVCYKQFIFSAGWFLLWEQSNQSRYKEMKEKNREYGLKCRVLKYPDRDPEAKAILPARLSFPGIFSSYCHSHLHLLCTSPCSVEQHLSAAQW